MNVETNRIIYDAVIVGGGPAGLAAALTLGRARKRVLLCDAGPRRNAAATHVHNFVTRDGITPAEFRRIGRQQLEPYANVDARDVGVREITGERGAFKVRLDVDGGVDGDGGEGGDRGNRGDGGSVVLASRIMLCTGMIDEPPAIDGMRELWGTSIFQCPYCHGWEVQDQRFAYLAAHAEMMEQFALLLRGWTNDVVVLTNGAFTIPPEVRANVIGGGVRIEERAIARLLADGESRDRLAAIEFLADRSSTAQPSPHAAPTNVDASGITDGNKLERDALFIHPAQRQVDVVRALGVALDAKGYVQVDEMTRQTSVPGVYAAGDLTTQAQGAIISAAAGMRAAAMLNHSLTLEMVSAGALV
jgi:thioredoxin reductase